MRFKGQSLQKGWQKINPSSTAAVSCKIQQFITISLLQWPGLSENRAKQGPKIPKGSQFSPVELPQIATVLGGPFPIFKHKSLHSHGEAQALRLKVQIGISGFCRIFSQALSKPTVGEAWWAKFCTLKDGSKFWEKRTPCRLAQLHKIARLQRFAY